MVWTDFDRFMLALTMWREARNQGHDGMRAVGHVIFNRSVAWNKTIGQICTQHGEFSSITFPGDIQLGFWPLMHDPKFEDAMQLAEVIMGAHDADNTGGSLYYWNPAASTPGGWFARNIAGKPDQFERVMTLGLHEFYRPVSNAVQS